MVGIFNVYREQLLKFGCRYGYFYSLIRVHSRLFAVEILFRQIPAKQCLHGFVPSTTTLRL
jgi:hypothetical protein